MCASFTSLVGIIVGIFGWGVYNKLTNAVCRSKKRLDGKTVIVTGGTAGMGLETATELARRGAKVIVACPFEEEGKQARSHIIEISKNENVVFKHLELGLLESVRAFASDIMKTEERLDILINNAGIGITNDFITKDGMDFMLQVNFFGAFLLTLLLLPLLKKSGKPLEPSRILNTSSIAHWLGIVDTDNINTVGYRWFPSLHALIAYANSKLFYVLFTHELAKKLNNSHVVVNTIDPGAVGTSIFLRWKYIFGKFVRLAFYYLSKTPWQGAQTALHVALDVKAGEVSGMYFKNCQLTKASALGQDDKTAEKLWEESVKLVKLSDDELNMCLKY